MLKLLAPFPDVKWGGPCGRPAPQLLTGCAALPPDRLASAQVLEAMDEDELLLARMEAGLFTLQQVEGGREDVEWVYDWSCVAEGMEDARVLAPLFWQRERPSSLVPFCLHTAMLSTYPFRLRWCWALSGCSRRRR